MSDSTAKTYHCIINPITGRKRPQFLTQCIESLAQQCQVEAKVYYTQDAHHLPLLIKTLLNEQKNHLIVAGGDGTINEAASQLVRHPSAVLGIIPNGSGNGLARHLKLSLDPPTAIRNIFQRAVITSIDVGRVNDRYFFSNAGLGYDADVVNDYNGYGQRGFWSYAKASLSTFLRTSLWQYRLEDESEWHKTYFINVANASQYGYGFKIAPQAEIQDGFLDVSIGQGNPQRGLLALGMSMLIGYPTDVVIRNQCTHLQLNTDRAVSLQLDGEWVGSVRVANFSVIPAALRLFV